VLGPEEGFALGVDVGVFVGSLVGIAVGSCVGSGVGRGVGLRLGELEGIAVLHAICGASEFTNCCSSLKSLR
jgi:hypothetical protein